MHCNIIALGTSLAPRSHEQTTKGCTRLFGRVTVSSPLKYCTRAVAVLSCLVVELDGPICACALIDTIQKVVLVSKAIACARCGLKYAEDN